MSITVERHSRHSGQHHHQVSNGGLSSRASMRDASVMDASVREGRDMCNPSQTGSEACHGRAVSENPLVE